MATLEICFDRESYIYKILNITTGVLFLICAVQDIINGCSFVLPIKYIMRESKQQIQLLSGNWILSNFNDGTEFHIVITFVFTLSVHSYPNKKPDVPVN